LFLLHTATPTSLSNAAMWLTMYVARSSFSPDTLVRAVGDGSNRASISFSAWVAAVGVSGWGQHHRVGGDLWVGVESLGGGHINCGNISRPRPAQHKTHLRDAADPPSQALQKRVGQVGAQLPGEPPVLLLVHHQRAHREQRVQPQGEEVRRALRERVDVDGPPDARRPLLLTLPVECWW